MSIKAIMMLGSLNRGGTETLILDVLRNTNPKDIEYICLYRKGGQLLSSFQNTVFKCVNIYPKFKGDILYFLRLRKLIKSNKIEVVHAQQVLDAFYIYIASLGLNIKIFLSIHGYENEYSKNYKKIVKYVLNRTTTNFYVSRHVKESFCRTFHLKNDNNIVLYNGIDFSKLEKSNKTLKVELKIKEDDILIGMIGNFYNSVRDQITVCKAFLKINKMKPNTYLVFVGAKSKDKPFYFDQCVNFCKENSIDDKVFFLGSRNDVPDILNSIDVYVYASNSDTFGISVIEAMMKKVPTIINDIPPFLEISDNGKYASIYKTKDIEDLCVKFFLLLDKIESETQVNDAYNWAIENFSISSHIKLLSKLYQNPNE